MLAWTLDRLGTLGWGWVAVFVLLDLTALTCAVLALTSERRMRERALVVGAGAVVGALLATGVAVVVGLGLAYWTTTESSGINPADKARSLAEGISMAMNAAVFGPVFTLVAGIATIVPLFAVCWGPSQR